MFVFLLQLHPESDRELLSESKTHIKRKLSKHGTVVAMEGQTLVTARRQLLLHLSPDALEGVTGASTLNAFYHVLTLKAAQAARLEDM